MAEPALGYEQALRYAQELRELYQRERARSEELKATVEALRRTDELRRQLLAQVVNAQEEERKRIAGDIHDDSIQIMTAVVMRLDMLRDELTGDEREMVDRLEETVRRAIDRLRHLLFELRPSILDREGLLPALRSYLANVETEFGPSYRMSASLPTEPPPDLRLVLYRLAQEALTNARKHAQATMIEVAVEERDGGVLLTVTDDGSGFRLIDARDADPRHLGMAAMHERAEQAGGWCRVRSEPGAGTSVQFWIPGAREA